jgi:hypothetical protein
VSGYINVKLLCGDSETLLRVSHDLSVSVMQWLRNFDQRLRESMEYALCLNSLGSSSDRMWLHVSKPPENAFIKQIHSVCTLPSPFIYFSLFLISYCRFRGPVLVKRSFLFFFFFPRRSESSASKTTLGKI